MAKTSPKSAKKAKKSEGKPSVKDNKTSTKKKSVDKKEKVVDKKIKSKEKSKKGTKEAITKPKKAVKNKVTNNESVITPPPPAIESVSENQTPNNQDNAPVAPSVAETPAEQTVAPAVQEVATENTVNEPVNPPPAPEKPVENTVNEVVAPTPEPEKPFDIYDGESVKEVLDFPVTELQTQTQLAVSRYAVDVKRLPQDVVNKINDYLTDFRGFLASPNDVSKIPIIMQKDQIACDAINAWIAPKKEYFEAQKLKQAGGIAITQATDNKTIIDKNNSQDVINQAPSVPSAINNNEIQPPVVNPLPFHPQAGQNPTPNSVNYNQHQFVPRNPTSDFEHTINSAIVNNNNNGVINLPPAYNDNSKDVNKIMAQMAQNTAPKSQVPISTPINNNSNFLEEYAKTIYETVRATFQHNHWGYIPLSILTGILKNTEKSLSYEIVMGGEQSFVKVSNGGKTVETARFSCKQD